VRAAATATVLALTVAVALTFGSTGDTRAAHEAEPATEKGPAAEAAANATGEHRAGEPGEGDHAASEHAGAEHGEPSIDGKKLAAQIFNFALLLAVLIGFGGRAVSKALAARHQQLKADLASASEARAAAEAQLKMQENRLAKLEQEIVAIRTGIKQEAESEKARLIELAEERARRIQDETKFVIEQQVKQAEADLKHEAAQAAVDMAEQIVRKSLDSADRQRMVDSFVADVGKPASPSASGGQV